MRNSLIFTVRINLDNGGHILTIASNQGIGVIPDIITTYMESSEWELFGDWSHSTEINANIGNGVLHSVDVKRWTR